MAEGAISTTPTSCSAEEVETALLAGKCLMDLPQNPSDSDVGIYIVILSFTLLLLLLPLKILVRCLTVDTTTEEVFID